MLKDPDCAYLMDVCRDEERNRLKGDWKGSKEGTMIRDMPAMRGNCRRIARYAALDPSGRPGRTWWA